jgi:hypothetical protein
MAAPLASTFQTVVDSLPDDWSEMELDLRIFDEDRYVEAATFMVTCNAQPYSHHDWHWRLLVAHRFGHAAAAPTVHGCAPGHQRARRDRQRLGPAGVLAPGVPPHPGAVARAVVARAAT